MYLVPRDNRCNKLFVKTRRTIPQKCDSFDSSIKKDAQDLKQLCAIPKPVINEKRLQVNGNKATQEISAQHEAMIHYIHSSWWCIKQELEHSSKQQTLNSDSNGTTNSNVQSGAASGKIKYISARTTSSIPKNFVPFDLESFWGQRIYQNLLQSS